MLASHDVIKKPVLTEKSTFAMNELKHYTFQVDPRASKDDVRRAVQELFKVRVEKVTTKTSKGGRRRLKYGWVARSPVKQAIVRLHKDDAIDMF
ncbi:MAG: 50S ribosomal protein L23 [Phycisphaerae bacterium]|nr:50S ribosomal protein L23 [Phycisphaerae bacterium]